MMVKIKLDKKIILEDILVANRIFDRLIGLMFAKKPNNGNGLLLTPCNSIHTCFMWYSLDVVFLNKENQIIKIIRNLRPWRITWIYWRATKTLEVPAGNLPLALKEGDYLEVDFV